MGMLQNKGIHSLYPPAGFIEGAENVTRMG
jgi:hypothetical protein